MDLLTALMHETGHLLGHDHEEAGVMTETLATETRPGTCPNKDAAVAWFASDAFFALQVEDQDTFWVGSGIRKKK